MNRKEFLHQFWIRIIKPFSIILIFSFFIRFLIKVFDENSNERQFLELLFSGIVIILLVLGFLLLLRQLFRYTKSKFPPSFFKWIDKNRRLLNLLYYLLLVSAYIYFTTRIIAREAYWDLIVFNLTIIWHEVDNRLQNKKRISVAKEEVN